MLYVFTDDDRAAALDAADRAALLEVDGLITQTEQMIEARRQDRLLHDQHTANYRGALGEIAVARVTGLEWGGYWVGGIDVLPNIEVKTINTKGAGPYLTPADLDDDRLELLAAVYLEGDTAAQVYGICSLVAGYAKGRECAEKYRNACCKHYPDTGNLRINRRHLRPIETLKEIHQ